MHARLAYVVRVDNRASIAYAAAPARSVRRGVVSPEVLMRPLSPQCDASRTKRLHARLAYVRRLHERLPYVVRVDDRVSVAHVAVTPAV